MNIHVRPSMLLWWEHHEYHVVNDRMQKLSSTYRTICQLIPFVPMKPPIKFDTVMSGLCIVYRYSMSVKLLELLSLKGGYTGSFKSTPFKMPHCCTFYQTYSSHFPLQFRLASRFHKIRRCLNWGTSNKICVKAIHNNFLKAKLFVHHSLRAGLC